MVRLFSSNHPFLVVLLAAYATALKLLHAWSGSPASDPEGGMLFQFFHSLIIHSAGPALTFHILAVTLITVQAISLNRIASKYKLFGTASHIGAMFYVTLIYLFPSMSSFNAVMAANTFLVFALGLLFDTCKEPLAARQIFDAGFLTGVGALFYPPVLLVVLCLIIAINLLRPFRWREDVICLAGVCMPFLFTGTIFLWKDRMADFIPALAISTALPHFVREPGLSIELKSALMALLLIWALVRLQVSMLKISVQLRKFYLILFWLMLIGAVSLVAGNTVRISHFALPALPASVFMANFVQGTKSGFFAELLHLAVLGTIVVFLLIP